MNKQIICDTGIISRFLRGTKTIEDKIYYEIGIDNIAISPTIRIELLNWLSGYKVDKSMRAKYLKYIRTIPVIHITEAVSRKAIAISDQDINAKPSDTLIGALCVTKKLPIYTLNTKHFSTIKGLKLV